MYINMNVEPAPFWEESKRSIPVNDYEKMGSLSKSESASPIASPYCGHFYKEENVYQYCDRNFNFSSNATGGVTSEDDDYHQPTSKRKITVTRDPMSHRIIEKRRRDRMNNCLADLSRLIPTEYLKKGRGRIEKTEIIEMAIKHMKYLQALTCNNVESCDMNENIQAGGGIHNKHQFVNGAKVEHHELSTPDHYKLGYKECLAETMRFFVELQGFFSTDTLCVKLINHLQKYYEKLSKGEKLISNGKEHVDPPDSEESKVKNYCSDSNEAATNANTAKPVITIVRTEDSSPENDSVNGHLTEVLVDSRMNNLYSPSIRPDVMENSPPISVSPCTDNTNDNHSSNGSLYKYKSYILERFVHANAADKSDIPSMDLCNTKRQTDSTDTIHSAFSMPEHYRNGSRPVPIFALHSNGSYYVPLTVDSHLLSPFLTEPDSCGYDVHGFSTLLLHPVTISVNFSRPAAAQPSTLLASNLSISPDPVFGARASGNYARTQR